MKGWLVCFTESAQVSLACSQHPHLAFIQTVTFIPFVACFVYLDSYSQGILVIYKSRCAMYLLLFYIMGSFYHRVLGSDS